MKHQKSSIFGRSALAVIVVIAIALLSLHTFFEVLVEPVAGALQREVALPLDLWVWIVAAIVARACVYVASSRARLQKAAARLAALTVLCVVAWVVSDLVVHDVYGGRYAVRKAGSYYTYTKSPARMKRTTRRGYEIIRGWNKASQVALAGLWLPILFVALECGASVIAPQREAKGMDAATLLGLPPRLAQGLEQGLEQVLLRPEPEPEVHAGPEDPAWCRAVATARELGD